jgi:hypothetical protein
MKLKEGVDARGVDPRIWAAIWIAGLTRPGGELVVTSLRRAYNGVSLHGVGKAFDCRTRDLTDVQVEIWREQLALALGRAWDVVVEADHMHIELDDSETI